MSKGRPHLKPVIIDAVKYWRCSFCKDYRPEKRFTVNNRKRNGLQSWCRDCQAEHDNQKKLKVAVKSMRLYLKQLEAGL